MILFQIIVVLIAMGVTGVNIWSFTKLKHDFDYKEYLPSDSYSIKYVDADRNYFPEDGTFVLVYCGVFMSIVYHVYNVQCWDSLFHLLVPRAANTFKLF